MKFTLEINMGNLEMQNADDIQDAVITALEALSHYPRVGDTANITDDGGNVVGKWEVTA